MSQTSIGEGASSSSSRDVFVRAETMHTLQFTPIRTKRTKRKHHKTNTGCSTCRLRRIKCDESRPSCNQCIKSGWDCEGYTTAITSADSPSKAHVKRTLLPKSSFTPKMSTMRIRMGPTFTDQRAGQYFRYYCENIAAQIGGPFSTSLWDRIVPQSGEVEPSIAYCIVALGALSKSRTYPWHYQSNRKDRSRTATGDQHYHYALIQYGKALAGIQAIKNVERDIRTVLISCLLVFCFECLLGRQAAASTYASSGVNVLYDHYQKKSKIGIVPTGDDLGEAIMGLDLQSLMLINTQGLDVHQRLKIDLNAAIQQMPPVFATFKECRVFWQLIMRRNFHFIATARDEIGKYNLQVADSNASTQEALRFSDTNHSCGLAYIPSDHIPASLLAERAEYRSDVRRWELASTELFSQPPQTTEEHVAITLLKIHVAMTKITCGLVFHETHPPEMGYDAYLPEFCTIVTLVASIQPFLISTPSRETSFHFDVGILPALATAASHCRNQKIRAEAIRLLLNAPGYREGIWDSLSIGHICDYKRKLEEEYLDEEGNVPGYRRCTMKMISLRLQERMARVRVKQWNGKEMTDWETKETVVRW